MPLTKKVGIVEVENQMDEFEKIYFNGDFFNRKNTKLYILCLCKGGSSKGYCYMGICHNAARWTEVFKVNVG